MPDASEQATRGTTRVLGVLHRVLGVLHRVLGVLHRVLGVLHRVLGIFKCVFALGAACHTVRNMRRCSLPYGWFNLPVR